MANRDTPDPGRGAGFWPFADRARADQRWRYSEIDVVLQKKPEQLTSLLLEVIA